MMKISLIQAVPAQMRPAGWWGSDQTAARTRSLPSRSFPIRLAVLAGLIMAGDILVWQVAPGLSLAVFAALCVAVSALMLERPATPRTLGLASGLTLLCLLPLVELVQPLSVLFAAAGLPAAFAVLTGRPLGRSWRMWWRAPIMTVLSLRHVAWPNASQMPTRVTLSAVLRGWAFPLGAGLLILGLLIEANPVLEAWVTSLEARPLPDLDAARLLFWAGLALMLWPLLALTQFASQVLPDARAARQGPPTPIPGINAPSITRSLVLFNLLFALQNGLDLAFLTGGVRLPGGMSYAEYAHRGAYPLVALALLSGLFALVARPFTSWNLWLRALLVVWVLQTVWLTMSSGLRLQLYIETYGLTRLRMAAGIWMGLVATGLCLILWQILAARANRWLLHRVAGLGVATLYLCSFASFDQAIATYNLTHPVPRDRIYLCTLEEAAIPVIEARSGQSIDRFCAGYGTAPRVLEPRDWREWGFRNARVRRSLAAQEGEVVLP